MPYFFEVHRDQFTISTDPGRLDMDAIVDMPQHAYWATGRPREKTERAFQNSLAFGVYDGDRQIGMARVVTDFAIFAYLCDVFIHEDYRARGLGKWLMPSILDHPELADMRLLLLQLEFQAITPEVVDLPTQLFFHYVTNVFLFVILGSLIIFSYIWSLTTK